ncbi:MAG: redoxin domain-containing protein [Planctomycetia bacterium]|nr:redoxin domain-containing protein [Planctomycetia bacterium]
MRNNLPGTALVLFLGWATAIAWADDPPQKDPPAQDSKAAQSPAAAFTAAKKAHEEASKAMDKVVTELQKKKERLSLQNKELNDVYQARNKASQELLKSAEVLAKAEPTTPLGFEAILAIINNGPPMLKPDIIKVLVEHHATNPKIGDIVIRLSRAPASKDMEALLNAIIEKNPNRDAKGNATFTLASMKMRNNPQEAEKLFEKVVSDYKDVKYFRGTLGERAEANLFEVRHLQIGKEVPEIEGVDTDGNKFKLSDYRGKVVMLDFWGHW